MNKRYTITFLLVLWAVNMLYSQAETNSYQKILDDATQKGLPAIVAAVQSPNAPLWQGKSGLSNIEGNIPLNINESFRLASITKLFTAVIILQLVDEKKITLTHPIATFLDPGIKSKIPNVNQINILQLLSHSSGIYSFTENNQFWKNCFYNGGMSRTWKPEELLSYIENKKPVSQPLAPFDKKFYSNTNYILLGMIIENITQNTLANTYKERIFNPLKMQDSFLEGFDTQGRKTIDSYAIPNSFFLKSAIKKNDIKKLRKDKLINLSNSYKLFNSWAWAAGGISSNIKDLFSFLSAVKQGSLLSEDTQKVLVDLYSAQENGMRFFGATGGSDGIQATMLHLMPQDLDIIILINSSGHKNNNLGTVFRALVKATPNSK